MDKFADQSAATPARAAEPNGRVLVVEDNVVNQKVLLAMLRKLGFSGDVANDGLEALDVLGGRTYDVVLMDCQMPNMDGYEATAAIRRSRSMRDTPIVAVTASAMAPDRERCLAAGMDDYIPKPIDIEELARILNRVARRSVAV